MNGMEKLGDDPLCGGRNKEYRKQVLDRSAKYAQGALDGVGQALTALQAMNKEFEEVPLQGPPVPLHAQLKQMYIAGAKLNDIGKDIRCGSMRGLLEAVGRYISNRVLYNCKLSMYAEPREPIDTYGIYTV